MNTDDADKFIKTLMRFWIPASEGVPQVNRLEF